jgi:rubrerythrin
MIAQIFLEANEPVMVKVFAEMSNVEEGHRKKLLKALKCYEEGNNISDRETAWKTPEPSLKLHDDALSRDIELNRITLEKVVFLMKESEKDTEEFYLEAVRMTDRKDLKALFINLAAEEAKHQRLINRIIHHAMVRQSSE